MTKDRELADTVAATDPGERAFVAKQPMLAERYELLGLIGTGGMGAVYRVRDKELGEVVALKMIRPEWSQRAEILERFRNEVRLARRVTHKNVARTYDIGEHDGEKFLTMELVDGPSLATRLADRGALPTREVIEIARAIADGLSAAHAAGIVHRDLKPDNVLIASDGRVVVTDFGIAHAGESAETAIVGTPLYAAPEQLVAGTPIDHRADLYALGAVIFEMLSGERAWRGEGTRPGVDERVAAIALRCVAVSPADRYASAEDISRELAAVVPTDAKVQHVALPSTPTGTTVAVMPFVNDSGEAEQYIADGLTSDFIDTLSMTRGLLVRPRGTKTRDVDVVVEGNVRRLGEAIRVTVRLIGVADGFQLSAQRFDTTLEHLLPATDDAARAVAEALTTSLPPAAEMRGVRDDPAAVELYLRAKQTFYKNWSHSSAAAAEQFERALALAPSNARILSATAMAWSRMMFFGEGDREKVIARGRELTERAVKLAPERGETWAALAGYRLNVGDTIGAAQALRSGLQHAPHSALVQESVGRLLAETTPLEESIARLEIALERDSSLLGARVDLSRVHGLLGNWQVADEMMTHLPSVSMGPAVAFDMHRLRLALWRGTPATISGPPPPNTYAKLLVETRLGTPLTDEQRAFMTSRVAGASGRIRALFLQRNAELHAYLGSFDEAIETVRDACNTNLVDVAWMDLCPLLAPLRKDIRFADLRAVVAERARAIVAALRGEA